MHLRLLVVIFWENITSTKWEFWWTILYFCVEKPSLMEKIGVTQFYLPNSGRIWWKQCAPRSICQKVSKERKKEIVCDIFYTNIIVDWLWIGLDGIMFVFSTFFLTSVYLCVKNNKDNNGIVDFLVASWNSVYNYKILFHLISHWLLRLI